MRRLIASDPLGVLEIRQLDFVFQYKDVSAADISVDPANLMERVQS